MESALRATLIVAVLSLAMWVAKYLHEHPVESELSRLRAEVHRLTEANERLHEENERFRTLVRGLREDVRVLDRRARDTLGMSRPDELLVFFRDGASEPVRR